MEKMILGKLKKILQIKKKYVALKIFKIKINSKINYKISSKISSIINFKIKNKLFNSLNKIMMNLKQIPQKNYLNKREYNNNNKVNNYSRVSKIIIKIIYIDEYILIFKVDLFSIKIVYLI